MRYLTDIRSETGGSYGITGSGGRGERLRNDQSRDPEESGETQRLRNHHSDRGGTDTSHLTNGSGGTDPGSERRTEGDQESRRGAGQFHQWCVDTSTALAESESARVDVYVRSMLPSPGAKNAQMTVLDNLAALCEETPIEDTAVNVWGERICLCDKCRESDTGTLMISTVREFESWGSEYDASTERFFERTRQQSSLVNDTYEGIVPPRVTVALYVDGSLQGVFPSEFGEEPYSVSDFYRSIRAENGTDRGADSAETDQHRGPMEPTS